MRPDRLTLFCLYLALTLLGGCTQWRYELGDELPVDEAPTANGRFALADALQLLGPPQRLSAATDGYVMAWEHWLIDQQSLGVGLSIIGLDMLSLDWGEARTRGDFLLLSFDDQHRLTGSALTHWDSSNGGGKGLLPFVSAIPLADVGDLTHPMPQHHWGDLQLLPLPEALNHASSPSSGQSGIEQRGTPAAIGQRSLEMR